MLFNLRKYKLLKKLEAEAEKAAYFVEVCELFYDGTPDTEKAINRAILRYYAILRRIEILEMNKKVAD